MNYYLKSIACPLCQHCKETRHIGKDSSNWRFYFQGYDDIKSYRDWKEIFNSMKYQIVDEDGDVMSYDDFDDMVQQSKGFKSHHRVFHGKPINNAEWEYVYNYHMRLPFTDRQPDANWEDEEGHPFTIGEFS